MSQTEMLAQILAMVARTEAKVDVLIIDYTRRRAVETGTTEEQQTEMLDGIIKEIAAKTIADGLAKLREGRKPYTGF